MEPRVYREFERICSERNIRGSVLEIGALPDDSSLLTMKSLSGATLKVGINLEGPSTYKDFSILKGDANAMTCFQDEQFDAVLCNAVLEHDRFFWKTLSEIRRVTKSGGLIIIGTPGFRTYALERSLRGSLALIPFFGRYFRAATLTLSVHNYPGDYYRFSPQAFRDVFFEGLEEVSIHSIMIPPRIIGCAVKR